MTIYLSDSSVESVVGGLAFGFQANNTVVNVPDNAVAGITNAITSVLVNGQHSIANLNIGPTLPFDAGSQGIDR